MASPRRLNDPQIDQFGRDIWGENKVVREARWLAANVEPDQIFAYGCHANGSGRLN
jgi:hypothetical protein